MVKHVNYKICTNFSVTLLVTHIISIPVACIFSPKTVHCEQSLRSIPNISNTEGQPMLHVSPIYLSENYKHTIAKRTLQLNCSHKNNNLEFQKNTHFLNLPIQNILVFIKTRKNVGVLNTKCLTIIIK